MLSSENPVQILEKFFRNKEMTEKRIVKKLTIDELRRKDSYLQEHLILADYDVIEVRRCCKVMTSFCVTEST